MEYTWVTVTEVVKETEKAILIRAEGSIWLPKSQVEVYEVDDKDMSDIAYSCKHYFAYVPCWLYAKNRGTFGWAESISFQLPDCAKRIGN